MHDIGVCSPAMSCCLRSSGDKKKKKKKPAEPTIPEGNESDEGSGSQSTGALSAATSEGFHEDEQMIANALEESLGICGDDPDIVEAKNRLLASNVLSPEMFEYSPSCDAADEIDNSDSLIGEDVNELDAGDLDADVGSTGEGATRSNDGEDDVEEGRTESSGSPYDPHRGIYSDSVYTEETPASESTNLLGSPEPTTPLRASIFTTVASIADDEENESKREHESS